MGQKSGVGNYAAPPELNTFFGIFGYRYVAPTTLLSPSPGHNSSNTRRKDDSSTVF